MAQLITWNNYIHIESKNISHNETGDTLIYDLPTPTDLSIRNEMLAANFNEREFIGFQIKEPISHSQGCFLIRLLKNCMIQTIGVELYKDKKHSHHTWFIEKRYLEIFQYFWNKEGALHFKELSSFELSFDYQWNEITST